jgi:hypothetical protein
VDADSVTAFRLLNLKFNSPNGNHRVNISRSLIGWLI